MITTHHHTNKTTNMAYVQCKDGKTYSASSKEGQECNLENTRISDSLYNICMKDPACKLKREQELAHQNKQLLLIALLIIVFFILIFNATKE